MSITRSKYNLFFLMMCLFFSNSSLAMDEQNNKKTPIKANRKDQEMNFVFWSESSEGYLSAKGEKVEIAPENTTSSMVWVFEPQDNKKNTFSIKHKESGLYLSAWNASNVYLISPILVKEKNQYTDWFIPDYGKRSWTIKNVKIQGYLDGRHASNELARVLKSESGPYTKWWVTPKEHSSSEFEEERASQSSEHKSFCRNNKKISEQGDSNGTTRGIKVKMNPKSSLNTHSYSSNLQESFSETQSEQESNGATRGIKVKMNTESSLILSDSSLSIESFDHDMTESIEQNSKFRSRPVKNLHDTRYSSRSNDKSILEQKKSNETRMQNKNNERPLESFGIRRGTTGKLTNMFENLKL